MTQAHYDFAGRVALVTGAASGMGAATAERFAAEGAAVAVVDLNPDAIAVVVDRITAAGGKAIGVVCDVTREDDVAEAVAATVDAYGRLDYAFNNAGIQIPAADAAEEDLAVFEKVNAVNLRGVWASMKHELAQMRTQDTGGAIVNCSSLGGLVGLPGRASYHATKYGVIGLTTSAALEYAPRGVRINAVCPGTFDTPMVAAMADSGDFQLEGALANIPAARLGDPVEIAAAVVWLCSDEASYVTGVALPVDGGYVAR